MKKLTCVFSKLIKVKDNYKLDSVSSEIITNQTETKFGEKYTILNDNTLPEHNSCIKSPKFTNYKNENTEKDVSKKEKDFLNDYEKPSSYTGKNFYFESTSSIENCLKMNPSVLNLTSKREENALEFLQKKTELPESLAYSPFQVGTEGNKNSKKNTYVISVNNSKYFHIGSSKTVNAYGFENNKPKKASNNNTVLETDLESWLDEEKILTEELILLIALNFENNWDSFGKNLGLPNDIIRETKARNNNTALIIYTLLKIFLKQYPNTSTGFILHILKNNYQVRVIEKLVTFKIINNK